MGSVVSQVFDQKLVNQLGLDLYAAFGVDPDKLDDWDGEKSQVLKSAPAVGQALAHHLVNGAYRALPHLLLSPDHTGNFPIVGMLESVMPGISTMWDPDSLVQVSQ